MDLQSISNAELVTRMEKLVRTERKITHLVLLHILEIESRRIYAYLGFDGMYTYLTRGLGYSEAAAYRRLQSARLLKQVPQVAEKIESGALHLSQLTRVQKCLKESAENGKMVSSAATLQVLEKIENKNSFETDKLLAQAFDMPIQASEILKPQKDESVRLEITLTAEQFADLEKAKSLLSHVCFEGSWSEVIATLAKKFNQKLQVSSTQRVIATKVVSPSHSGSGLSRRATPTPKSSSRRAISIHLKRALLEKAQSRCEYLNPKTGHRCNSKYQLQFDHEIPLAFGGSNSAENFRVLCRTHNLIMASRLGLSRP